MLAWASLPGGTGSIRMGVSGDGAVWLEGVTRATGARRSLDGGRTVWSGWAFWPGGERGYSRAWGVSADGW